eukprot:maker-scaffold_4-snap-gene-8.63-mRNA-1 protein AED:0.06 eAED:0.06 QI:84/1/1/1/1/1/4/88/231
MGSRSTSRTRHSSSTNSLAIRPVWFILTILILGSFIATLVQLSQGLHNELIETKENLASLKKKVVEISDEKEVLLHQHGESESKAFRLQKKSQTVLEELLTQQKKVKALQFELLSSRESLHSMVKNCTGDSNSLRTEFNLSLNYIEKLLTSNKEYKRLVDKLIKEKVEMELTVESLQFQISEVTDKLQKQGSNLVIAKNTIQREKGDLEKMNQQVRRANQAMAEAAALLKK